MPKYLVQATYSAEGIKGLLKEGGTKRKEAFSSVVTGLGGKVEAFYFEYGSQDVLVIIDVPDSATATAISLIVSSTGAARIQLSELLSPADIDKAVETAAPGYASNWEYHPPK